MKNRTSYVGLLGAILLLAGLLSFTVAGVGATPRNDHRPSAHLMQGEVTDPALDPSQPTTEPTSEPPPDSQEELPGDPVTETQSQPTAESHVDQQVQDPTEVPPTEEVPTEVPPTEQVPTEVPPTEQVPTEVPPTEDVPTAVPPTGEPVEELSSFSISKLFCAGIDESADEPCLGRVPAAEGTTVYFEVTYLEEGWSDTFGVEIGEFEGFTVASILLYDAPLGSYRITELVPQGYDGFAVALHDGQVAEGASVVIEVGPVPEEEEAFFVNIPLGQEPPPTGEPDPDAPPDDGGTAPEVDKPDVTPAAGEPVASEGTQASISTLPEAGTGKSSVASGGTMVLLLVSAATLLGAAIGIRLNRQRP